MSRSLPAALLLLFSTACGSGNDGPPDAGDPYAWMYSPGPGSGSGSGGPKDPGTRDGGTDAGMHDAGTQDAGGGVCVPQCAGRTCGPDGCGGTCGTCAFNQQCSANGQCACVPQCNGKVCGPDGCGGQCGTCGPSQACNAYGACQCVPNCQGRQCGSDGCGGSCGGCGANQACNSATGQCVCVPQCNGKSCGPDGCGGQCGSCPSNSTCASSGTHCVCGPGFVPNPQGTGCLQVGGACAGVSQYGYCSGDTWVRCDPHAGLVVLGCGAGNCKTVTAQGDGACACGSIDSNGLCMNADGSNGNAVHLYCVTGLGILMADNCVAKTGSGQGHCSTFVTAFGHQTSCLCGACQYDTGQGCASLCPGGACSYNAPGNFYTCY